MIKNGKIKSIPWRIVLNQFAYTCFPFDETDFFAKLCVQPKLSIVDILRAFEIYKLWIFLLPLFINMWTYAINTIFTHEYLKKILAFVFSGVECRYIKILTTSGPYLWEVSERVISLSIFLAQRR